MRLLLPPERGATPGSPQKPNPPAAPRIDSRGCDPRCSLGRNKDRLAHKLKVANRAGFVAEGSPARCAASAKRAVRDGYSFQFNGFCVPSLEPDCVRFPKVFLNPRGIPKGAALGAPLVTFPATGKSPGCRAERLHQGEERRGWGAAPPRIGEGPSGPEAIISLPEGKNNRLQSAVGC